MNVYRAYGSGIREFNIEGSSLERVLSCIFSWQNKEVQWAALEQDGVNLLLELIHSGDGKHFCHYGIGIAEITAFWLQPKGLTFQHCHIEDQAYNIRLLWATLIP